MVDDQLAIPVEQLQQGCVAVARLEYVAPVERRHRKVLSGIVEAGVLAEECVLSLLEFRASVGPFVGCHDLVLFGGFVHLSSLFLGCVLVRPVGSGARRSRT